MEKFLESIEKKYIYKIEEKGIGKDIIKSVFFTFLISLNIYLVYWLINNSDKLSIGILAGISVTLFFFAFYVPLFIIRQYHILDKGIVFDFSILGRYGKSRTIKLWKDTGDCVYKRLGQNKIRIGFWTSTIDTKSRFIFSTILNRINPAQSRAASRAVYMIKGNAEEIDFIEKKLRGIAKKGRF